MINLADEQFVIFGLKGSGKSWLTKHILDHTQNHIIYDPLNEHVGYRRYVPTDRHSIPELSRFLEQVVIPNANGRTPRGPNPRTCASLMRPTDICGMGVPLPPGVDDLVDFSRHMHVAVGYVCRRPVQFNTDIVELAETRCFFHLDGKNDIRYMNDLRGGLGDLVKGLRPHEFVVQRGVDVMVHSAIEKTGTPELYLTKKGAI